jgi:hypothetical protein
LQHLTQNKKKYIVLKKHRKTRHWMIFSFSSIALIKV